MTNFARVVNGVASDVCSDPSSKFHPAIASEFIEVPDDVVPGSFFKNDIWNPPVIQDIQEIGEVRISPFEFKLLFTPLERLAINEVKSTDPLISDFFTIIEDPRMSIVDLTLQSTKDIINHLVSVNIITQERSVDILAAKPV